MTPAGCPCAAVSSQHHDQVSRTSCTDSHGSRRRHQTDGTSTLTANGRAVRSFHPGAGHCYQHGFLDERRAVSTHTTLSARRSEKNSLALLTTWSPTSPRAPNHVRSPSERSEIDRKIARGAGVTRAICIFEPSLHVVDEPLDIARLGSWLDVPC